MTDMRKHIAEQKQIEARRREHAVIRAEYFRVPTGENRETEILWYRTKSCGNAPTMFHIHGGGFVFGEAQMDHVLCERFADELGVQVFSLQYHLAPENKYPGQTEECYEAIRYLQEHAGEYGIALDQCAVCGLSSGANVAAVTAILAKERETVRLAHQLLFYPFIDLVSDPRTKPGAEYVQWPELFEWFEGYSEFYTNSQKERGEIYVSPVLAEPEQLKGVPSAMVVVGDQDLLCQEGLRYAETLRKAGVRVRTEIVPGANHGFIDVGLNEDFLRMQVPPTLTDSEVDDYARSQSAMAEAAMHAVKEELISVLKLE